ncbi:hypothetical protein [Fulvivirga sp.]
MKAVLTFLFIILCLFTHAQKVEWASEVIEVSSEWRVSRHMVLIGDESYKAKQALDEPNIYPGSVSSTRAWAPRKDDEVDFIKVAFKNPMKIKQIAIAESLNPSAVSKVYAYDIQGVEYLINVFTPKPIPIKG